MSGHRPERTFHENGERNVCELDRYADKSYLGIHYWDLCWKVAYPKLKKIWNSNVRTWETVQIWGDCPICAVVYDYVLVSQTECDCFMNFYSRFYMYLHSRSCIKIYICTYTSVHFTGKLLITQTWLWGTFLWSQILSLATTWSKDCWKKRWNCLEVGGL